MRYAVIENNIVINILECDSIEEIPIGLQEKSILVPENLPLSLGDFYINDHFECDLKNYEQINNLKIILKELSYSINDLKNRIFILEKKII